MFVGRDRVLLPGSGFRVGHSECMRVRFQHEQRENLNLRLMIEPSPTAILAYLYASSQIPSVSGKYIG
jgi:hypothetical protein